LFAPENIGFDHCRFVQPALIVSSCY
jgi:hypothetical protein